MARPTIIAVLDYHPKVARGAQDGLVANLPTAFAGRTASYLIYIHLRHHCKLLTLRYEVVHGGRGQIFGDPISWLERNRFDLAHASEVELGFFHARLGPTGDRQRRMDNACL